MRLPKGLPYNTLQIVALLLVLIAGLWYLGSSPPSMTGDGLDYFHQLQSLFNHFSLDLREKDVTDFETVRAKSSFGPLKVANMHYNYRQTPDSNYYSFHFFTYPLAALPVKTLLHAIGSDEMRALEVTNVLFILLLMVVGLNTERHRILFLLTFIVGPILWYLKWPGPEVMLYCLFLLSLLLSQQGRHVASFFCAAIAASQFILFIPWVLILLWRNIHLLRIERASAKRYLLILAVTLLAFSSPLWYFWKFQSFSLLVSAGAAQKEYITSSKILSLLFDFNSGVLVFYPGLIVGVVLIARRVTSIAMLGFLFTIFYLTVSTSQVNWNSGMNMINRYSLMIVPIVLFFIYRGVVSRSLLDLRRLALICGFFMLNNASFVYSSTHRYAYTEFSPIAKLVMAKFPGAYNPEREIFSERALHAEVDARSPIYYPRYFISGASVKMLTSPSSASFDHLQYFSSSPVDTSGWGTFIDASNVTFYLNFILDLPALEKFCLGRSDSGKVSVVLLLDPGVPISARAAIQSFQIPVVICNKTTGEVGGIGSALSYHLYDKDAQLVRFENRQSESLPIIPPGGASLALVTVVNIEKVLAPYIAVDMFQPVRGWLKPDIVNPYSFERPSRTKL